MEGVRDLAKSNETALDVFQRHLSVQQGPFSTKDLRPYDVNNSTLHRLFHQRGAED